jgi:mannose-6-phosphate isomerase
MTDSLPDLIPLQPYLREMVWGGRRLEGLFGKRLPPASPIGEAWEVSGYPDQESIVASGPLAGRGLGELLHQFGADLVGDEAWGRFGETFPLLIKLIDAHIDLSIQVHPDDDYARREGIGQFGKSEAWVVLHSEGGQTALGLKEGVDRQEFSKALDAGRALDVVQFQDVTPGDVIFVPPGTVHAANAGIVIYEVQQPSDLTFRIYDYDRPGLDGEPRELHIERALDVINFESQDHVFSHFDAAGSAQGETLLVDSDNFRLSVATTPGGSTTHHSGDTCLAVTVIDGGSASFACGSAELVARPGDSLLVPPGRRLTVESASEAVADAVYLLASPPSKVAL